jgi:hypothetical protein
MTWAANALAQKEAQPGVKRAKLRAPFTFHLVAMGGLGGIDPQSYRDVRTALKQSSAPDDSVLQSGAHWLARAQADCFTAIGTAIGKASGRIPKRIPAKIRLRPDQRFATLPFRFGQRPPQPNRDIEDRQPPPPDREPDIPGDPGAIRPDLQELPVIGRRDDDFNEVIQGDPLPNQEDREPEPRPPVPPAVPAAGKRPKRARSSQGLSDHPPRSGQRCTSTANHPRSRSSPHPRRKDHPPQQVGSAAQAAPSSDNSDNA